MTQAISILIAEDEGIIARHIRATLLRLGYGISAVVSTGEEAVQAAYAHQPQLALLDIGLAGEMDGIAAARQIQQHAHIPVVFLTAHADASTLDRAKLAEPCGYLVKPFHDANLQATIEVALYKFQMDQRLRESERRYHIVADNTADWETWLGPDGRFIYCSPSCEQITGYTAEEFLADPGLADRIVHPDDRALYAAHHQLAYTARLPGRVEIRIIRRDGAVRYIDHLCRPVFDEVGDCLGTRASNRDATDRRAAETDLRANEAKYRNFIEQSAEAFVLVDETGSIIEWNPASERIIGLARADVLGRPVWAVRSLLGAPDSNDPEDQVRTKAIVLKALETGEGAFLNQPVEASFNGLDGVRRAIRQVTFPIKIGSRYWIGATILDITERKQAEQDLQAERDFAQAVVNAMGQGLTVTGPNQRFEFVNPAFVRLLGYTPPELLGRTPFDVTLPDDHGKLNDALSLRHSGETSSYDARLVQKAGSLVEVLITGSPRWRDGKAHGSIAVITDLTERKRVERAMAEERGRLRALVESSRDGLALIGMDGRLSILNQPMFDLTGLASHPGEWIGQPFEKLLEAVEAVTPIAPLLRAERERIRHGDEPAAEGEWTTSARALQWMNLPVLMDGRVLGRLIVLHDVTSERHLEKLRDDLTHAMVHDLRNPLTSLRGAVQVFAIDGLDALTRDQRDMLRVMEDTIQAMHDLVTAILDVSQLENGQMPLEREDLRLEALVGQVVRWQEPLAAQRRLELQFHAPPNLPALSGDPRLLERLAQNLVGNALKFTPEGGRVEVAVGAEANTLWLTVRDTGPGIAPDLQKQLFQKFVTGRGQGRGSGLGLAFCRLVAEAHGGCIGVESELGRGSTFTVNFPR